MEGKAIIFSAPSGSGKTTIVKHLIQEIPTLKFSISATTRSPRNGEVNGRDYYFLSNRDFQQRIQAGHFVEFEEVYPGLCYGTLKEEVEKIWANGNHVIFDVDVVGGYNLKQYFKSKSLAIFVKVSSMKELEKRLSSRNSESEESLRMRLEKAAAEMEYQPKFDQVIVNDRLDESLPEAKLLVDKFLKKK
jgi:guanylate kinase